jgi:hypothetical protein
MDDNVGKHIRGIVGFQFIFDFFQPPTSTTGWEVGGSQLGGRQWEWAGIEGSETYDTGSIPFFLPCVFSRPKKPKFACGHKIDFVTAKKKGQPCTIYYSQRHGKVDAAQRPHGCSPV